MIKELHETGDRRCTHCGARESDCSGDCPGGRPQDGTRGDLFRHGSGGPLGRVKRRSRVTGDSVKPPRGEKFDHGEDVLLPREFHLNR